MSVRAAVFSAIIFACATSLSAQDTAEQSANPTVSSEETQAWDAARDSNSSDAVFAYISAYPDGAYTKEAKALMIDLLWTELATNPPAATEAAAGEDAPAEAPVSLPVTFSTPLTDGSAEIIGKSLEELIAGSPLFPPVEGLPEEYWKTQECSSCHEWERANLCVQANTYLTVGGAENLIKEHPYGGTFKLNLRNWAEGGCE